MHPGRAARAVRDHHQPAVAAHRLALRRHLQREGPAPDRLLGIGGRVVQRHRPVLGRRGDRAEAHAPPVPGRTATTPARTPASAKNASCSFLFVDPKAPACGDADDAVPRPPGLAECDETQFSARRFQESASFSRRNSVGVRPVAALKARLKGPMDWKPASSAMLSTGRLRRAGSASAVRASVEPEAVDEGVEVAVPQALVDQPPQPVLGRAQPRGQAGDAQVFGAVGALLVHQALQRLGQRAGRRDRARAARRHPRLPRAGLGRLGARHRRSGRRARTGRSRSPPAAASRRRPPPRSPATAPRPPSPSCPRAGPAARPGARPASPACRPRPSPR